MEIRYSKAATKAIEALDRPTKQRIRAGYWGSRKSHHRAI